MRVVVLAPRQWRAMRAWLGEPAAFQDERYDAIPARLEASAELHELYAALFAGMTKDAIAAEGQARGVPVAPVLEVAEVLASRHFAVARRVRRRRGRTGRARPAAERVLRDRRRARRLPPPRARARRAQRRSRGRARAAGAARPRRTDAAPSRPLAGLRVIDFGIIVIGNEIGRLLADQGADVIKIENRAFPDAARVGYGGKLSHSFVAGSRNKRSFGVNLRTPGGCRPPQAARRRRRRRARELQAGDAREARARLRGAARRQARHRDAEHQRPRLDRAVEPMARLRPDRALRLGDREPLALSGATSSPFGEPTTIYPDHYGARVCATTVLAALDPAAPDGGRRLRRERAGRDDREPARRRLPRRLARRRARRPRRAVGHLPVRRRRRVVRHHGLATTSSGWPCAGRPRRPGMGRRRLVRQRGRAHRQPRASRPPPDRVDARASAARRDGTAPGSRRAGRDDDAAGRPRAGPAPAVARCLARDAPARPRRRAPGGRPVPLAERPADPCQPGAAARRAHARDLRLGARPVAAGDRGAPRGRRPRGAALTPAGALAA